MSTQSNYYVGTMDREEVARLADARTVIVIPTGATEQHGYLPLDTDTLLAERLALRLVRRHEAKFAIAPAVAVGYSEHHFPYPALSLRPETFRLVLLDMIGSLVRTGFRRFLLLNGHGGNDELIRIAARESVQAWNCRVSALSYWQPALRELYRIRDEFGLMFTIPGHGGACEAALLAALYPDRFDLNRIAANMPLPEAAAKLPYFDPPYMHYHGSVQSWNGYSDDPRPATVRMGQRFLEAIESALDGTIAETLLQDRVRADVDYRML